MPFISEDTFNSFFDANTHEVVLFSGRPLQTIHATQAMALLRSPFTDLTSSFENYEAVKRCRDFNMQLSLCKEAYGLHRSDKMCRDEYEDFRECIFGFKQLRRAQLIQEERKKLYKSGELKEQYAEAPPLDSLNNRTNPL